MASGCGEAEVVHFTWLSHGFLLQSPRGVLFPVQHTRHLSLFSRPLEDDGLLSYNVWTSGDITIKTNRGFLLTKLKEVAEMRGRRRRAGPELWFEVILSHKGTFSSSSSPSGKTDRVQPHEDSSAPPVILPKTADIQRGKNTFHESYVRKPYHSVSYCLCLKVFSVFRWLKVAKRAECFQIVFYLFGISSLTFFSCIKRLKEIKNLI